MNYERWKDPRAVRRIALGFGLGFLFGCGPFIPLHTIWDRSSPPPLPVLIAVGVSLAVVAPISIFSAFSWALFYRCRKCKQRVKRLKREPLIGEADYSLQYPCNECEIQWDVFWRERAVTAMVENLFAFETIILVRRKAGQVRRFSFHRLLPFPHVVSIASMKDPLPQMRRRSHSSNSPCSRSCSMYTVQNR